MGRAQQTTGKETVKQGRLAWVRGGHRTPALSSERKQDSSKIKDSASFRPFKLTLFFPTKRKLMPHKMSIFFKAPTLATGKGNKGCF